MRNEWGMSMMLAAVVAGCMGPETPPVPVQTSRPGGVIVQLFEWRWADVAEECEAFLGPKGYSAVQVSSPAENAVVKGRPWWERYQPVRYKLVTRSGDRAAFADMVARCKAAGVDIYVDAVLNHMTGVYAGVGTAGDTFSEYNYPGLYDRADFHHCGITPGDDIEDWNDPAQVRTCELVNLADLDTGAEKVRARLAAYLNDLVGLGVAGFRLDAARHMAPKDISAIFSRVAGDPYVYQEVVDPDPPHWATPYFGTGAVTEFQYSQKVGEAFLSGRLDRLHGPGSIWEQAHFLPSDSALVFIDNHDNQRHGSHIVTYKDGALHDLANVFMLAYPYGRPRLMSSYAFEDPDQGPPADVEAHTMPVYDGATVRCGESWQCEHRHVAGMVGFRNVTAPADSVTHWWTNGSDQIAFGRADRGFVVINRAEMGLSVTLSTGMAPGDYCDVVSGERADTDCTGGRVRVNADHSVDVRLGPVQALAFDLTTKL